MTFAGHRSSSLHYAACFGRPHIAKVLLRHGANPDLRDEDGKTPLDKARERMDEGHREVAAVLQSPGMVYFFFIYFHLLSKIRILYNVY